MLKEMQARQKAGLVEQGSSLGNKMHKMLSGSNVRCHGQKTEMLLITVRRKCAAKAQLELKLSRIVEDNKRSFSNLFMAKGSVEKNQPVTG